MPVATSRLPCLTPGTLMPGTPNVAPRSRSRLRKGGINGSDRGVRKLAKVCRFAESCVRDSFEE
jgi:hypothetical protein